MTIQELADAYVGHPEEIDEDSAITAQRESFKWGALCVLKEVENALKLGSAPHVSIQFVLQKIRELKGENFINKISNLE